MRLSRRLLIALTAASALALPRLFAADPAPAPSAARILAHTKILASDEFEGRAPASPGEEKTVAYLEREFRALGLAPGNPNGTFVQSVALVGITSRVTTAFTVGDRTLTPEALTEGVTLSRRLAPRVAVNASELVFVGYGISAPEFGWDDYKGVDVRGKTVVMLINDPPVTDATGRLDPAVFGGNAMTYYGRWTYKYEIASAKGAAACLIVHETGPAGYPFAVVAANGGRENFDLRSPDANASRVAVEGWLALDFTRALFTAAGEDFAKLKAAAATREFKPVPLKARASFTVANQIRDVVSRNVVALLPGADPVRRAEFVIFTAHWDAFGRNPALAGDQILNGAADNAIAVAMLLELARAAVALPVAARPARSLLFLSPTAEEKGLLGSRYYVERPLYPLARTLAAINLEPIDANGAYGPTRDLEIVGQNPSTLDDLAAEVAREQGRVLRPDTEAAKGYYYRSDHFEFAKAGVPAFIARSGLDFIGRPAGYGAKLREAYLLHDYHKVTDEIRPDWTMEGAAQNTAFLLALGLRVANSSAWPEWKPGTEFKARRDSMLKR